MKRLVIIARFAAALAILVLAGGLWWQIDESAGLRDRLESLQSSLAEEIDDARERSGTRGLTQARALQVSLDKLDRRVQALEGQVSLAIAFIESQRAVARQSKARAQELSDRIGAVREDLDLILSREWERMEAESDDAGMPVAAAPAVPVAPSEPEAQAANGDLVDAESTPQEPETAEQDKEAAQAADPVLDSLVRESEISWRRDFAEMAQLNSEQREKLDRVLDVLYVKNSESIERVLNGKASASAVQRSLREAHRDANRSLQGILNSRQRESLRAELQRRNELYWSIWLSSM